MLSLYRKQNIIELSDRGVVPRKPIIRDRLEDGVRDLMDEAIVIDLYGMAETWWKQSGFQFLPVQWRPNQGELAGGDGLHIVPVGDGADGDVAGEGPVLRMKRLRGRRIGFQGESGRQLLFVVGRLKPMTPAPLVEDVAWKISADRFQGTSVWGYGEFGLGICQRQRGHEVVSDLRMVAEP